MLALRAAAGRPGIPGARLALGTALALALATRWWQIDLTQFGSEQGTLLGAAAAFLDTGRIPLTSGLVFTIGVGHPPLITFLLTLPMILSRDPVWISFFQSGVDASAVIFLYLTGRDLGSRWGGMAAGIAYATCPAAVLFGRMVWNPDLVPVFSAAALWGTVGFLRWGDTRRLAAAGLAIACAAQLHPSAAVFLPFLVTIGAIRWQMVRWRPLAVAGAVLALILAPYLARQFATDWGDLRAALVYAAGERHFSTDGGYVVASLVTGGYAQQITAGVATGSVDFDWSFLRQPATWLIAGLMALGALEALRTRAGWAVVAWLFLPALATLRVTESVFPHYLLDVLPAGALLVGLGVAACRPRWIGMTLLVALTAGRLIEEVRFLQGVAAMEAGPRYGVPVRYSQEAARLALTLNDQPTIFVGEPEALGPSFTYLTGDRFPIGRFDSQSSLVLRPSGAFYVTRPGPGSVALKEAFGPPEGRVELSNGMPIYELFRLPPDRVRSYLSGLRMNEINAVAAGVLKLSGYSSEDLVAGHDAPFLLRSETVAPAVSRWPDLRLFGHLVSADGHRWSRNPDLNPFQVADWQPGDTVLTWFLLRPPPDAPLGGYWLEMGLYQTYASTPLPLTDGSFDLGSRLRIGPLRLAGGAAAATEARLATFGDEEIELVATDIAQDRAILTWRARVKPGRDYTVFVHGLDVQGRLAAQDDGPPVRGSFPTSLWEPGDLVVDSRQLSGDLSTVTSWVIGLYTRSDLKRLPVVDAAGAILGDAYVFTAVRA